MFSTNKLKVETSDGRNFRLLESFTFTRKDGKAVEVEAGAESDGASTPRLLWRVLPPFGKHWMADFLHDDLYRRSKYSKEFCDETYLEALDCLDCGEIVEHLMYEGVRLGGGSAFEEDREMLRNGEEL